MQLIPYTFCTYPTKQLDCGQLWVLKTQLLIADNYAAFRLACHSPHCCLNGEICLTAQVSLATEGRPSGKQHLPNKLIALPLCSQRQTAGNQILFNLGRMLLGDEGKAVWPLRGVSIKLHATQQQSGKWQACLKPTFDRLYVSPVVSGPN